MFDLDRLTQIRDGNEAAALCTVTATSGSTPRKAGASMVVFADGSDVGRIEGTIGGGAVEHEVRRAALAAISQTRPRQMTVALTTQLGMCCGGQMTLFIEPVRTHPPCILFGAGHVAEKLCAVAAAAGFRVTVCDPRDELRTAERFPNAHALVDDYEEEDFDALPFGPDAFVVVVTHDHPTDQRLAELALRRQTRYVAMIGSARKAKLARERALAKGLPAADVDRLKSPAGLDIGAETPEEIAVSIVAEMIQVRRQAAAAADANLDSERAAS